MSNPITTAIENLLSARAHLKTKPKARGKAEQAVASAEAALVEVSPVPYTETFTAWNAAEKSWDVETGRPVYSRFGAYPAELVSRIADSIAAATVEE